MMPRTSSQRLQIAWNREGVIFLFLALGLAFASIYTGQNAMVLLFSIFVVAIGFSVYLGGRNVAALVIERRFVEDIFAQQEVQIELIVRNLGAQTRYGLHIYEDFGDVSEIGPMYISKLGTQQTAVLRYSCVFPKRGVSHFQQIQVRSRFPLPFFEFRSRKPNPDIALVYPSLDSGTEFLYFGLSEGAVSNRRTVHDWKIQPVQAGRITGRILWKLSARRGQLLQRHARFRSHVKSELISLKSRQELGTVAFEQQISQVSSYGLASLERGHTIALYSSRGVCLLESGRGEAQRLALLKILAQI